MLQSQIILSRRSNVCGWQQLRFGNLTKNSTVDWHNEQQRRQGRRIGMDVRSFLSSSLSQLDPEWDSSKGPDRSSATSHRTATRKYHCCSSTTAVALRSRSAAASAAYHTTLRPLQAAAANGSNNLVRDRDLERYLQDSMSQFLPQPVAWDRVAPAPKRTLSRLELELGHDEDEATEGHFAENLWTMDEYEDELLNVPELTDIPETAPEPTSRPQQHQQRCHQKSVMELLAVFDPQNPPNLSDFERREDALEELQLWLECEAQQEAVTRYQKVIDEARDRKDYSSLSMVQRQIVEWFRPLQEAIEKKQKDFVTKQSPTVPSGKKFGPFICSLPAAKLAVIVAHEAVIQSLLNKNNRKNTGKGNNSNGRGGGGGMSRSTVKGVNLVSIANRIGQAVEDELVVHRLLHKRAQTALRDAKQRTTIAVATGFESNVSAVFADSSESSRSDADALLLTEEENHGAENATGVSPSSPHNGIAVDSNVTHKWTYASSHLKNYLDEISQYQPSAKKRRVTAYAIQKARQILEKDEEWTVYEKVQLGAALIQTLLESATVIGENGKSEMAFTLEKRWVSDGKIQTFVVMHDRLYQMIVADKLESLSASTTRHKPMIVPPKPWSAVKDGGYLMLKVDLMRYHGCHTQREALHNADSSIVFDGLNALGRVKWRINKRLLDVAQKCWTENIPLGDIPSRTDLDVPDEPEAPVRSETKLEKGTEMYDLSVAEFRKYRERMLKHNRIKQKNMVHLHRKIGRTNYIAATRTVSLIVVFAFVAQDLRSLRCSVVLKLDQAEKFKDFDEIYFPYNMDFRGRAYPVPPHLSNVGSDLCRGMLTFAEGKPLGERGLYWLKVHLANFAGKDKMTFDDRANFVDEHMDQVRESANDPFGGERWWMKLEDPFQGLATCFEIVNAMDSDDPASYMCSLPVHMDGSCNGLQHYAALGRDSIGGKAVNLCATEEPQDVYVGVMHEVIRRVTAEADREVDFDSSCLESLSRKQKKALVNNRAAKLVNGLIDRGVVKRTVMTSVYGVTYIGARQQIQEKIESKVQYSPFHSNACPLSWWH